MSDATISNRVGLAKSNIEAALEEHCANHSRTEAWAAIHDSLVVALHYLEQVSDRLPEDGS